MSDFDSSHRRNHSEHELDDSLLLGPAGNALSLPFQELPEGVADSVKATLLLKVDLTCLSLLWLLLYII